MPYSADLSLNSVLMDGISDMVFVMHVEGDSEFIYDFVNRAALDGVGMTHQDLGKSIQEVCSPEYAAFLKEQYQKVIITRDSVTFEDTYMASDHDHYSETTLTPLFDDDNRFTQIVAVVKDITAERRAEIQMNKVLNHLEESKKRYQSLFHHNSDAVMSLDLKGRITNGNVMVEHVTGYTPVELIGSKLNRLVVDEDANLIKRLFMEAVAGTTEKSRLAIQNKAGGRVELSLKVTPLIIDEEVIGIYVILKDITDIIKAHHKLEESEERFRIIAENANDLISLINHKGEIIYASPSYKDILGFDNKEYEGKLFLYNIHPDDRNHLEKKIIRSIKDGQPFTATYKQFNHENVPVWSQTHGTPVYDNQNNFKHMVIVTRDISLQKEYEAKLEHFALHDSLTGLPNRRLFKERLGEALEAMQTNRSSLAVILMDVDHFKNINDEMGHDIGDGVIEEFGKRVNRTLRHNDMVARLGGDEFVIFLPEIESADEAVRVAKKIQNAMAEPWNIYGKSLHVTTSMGIAMAPSEGASTFSMLKNADIALYEAKDSGRNSYKLRA